MSREQRYMDEISLLSTPTKCCQSSSPNDKSPADKENMYSRVTRLSFGHNSTTDTLKSPRSFAQDGSPMASTRENRTSRQATSRLKPTREFKVYQDSLRQMLTTTAIEPPSTPTPNGKETALQDKELFRTPLRRIFDGFTATNIEVSPFPDKTPRGTLIKQWSPIKASQAKKGADLSSKPDRQGFEPVAVTPITLATPAQAFALAKTSTASPDMRLIFRRISSLNRYQSKEENDGEVTRLKRKLRNLTVALHEAERRAEAERRYQSGALDVQPSGVGAATSDELQFSSMSSVHLSEARQNETMETRTLMDTLVAKENELFVAQAEILALKAEIMERDMRDPLQVQRKRLAMIELDQELRRCGLARDCSPSCSL